LRQTKRKTDIVEKVPFTSLHRYSKHSNYEKIGSELTLWGHFVTYVYGSSTNNFQFYVKDKPFVFLHVEKSWCAGLVHRNFTVD
jgi:hypothetical protein